MKLYELLNNTLTKITTKLAFRNPSKRITMSDIPVNPDDFTVVKEGSASILYPKGNKVFYNPVQQFNRDLSVVGIRAWSELFAEHKKSKKENITKKKRTISEVEDEDKSTPTKNQDATAQAAVDHQMTRDNKNTPFVNILEGLSATGLRAIRYGKEIPNVRQVVANDFLPEAVKAIDRNILYNEISSKVKSNQGDAIKFMNTSTEKNFNVIDLDPYGTAAPFIDSAIQCISNDGLLLVTCTDLSVLAGNGYPEKCFALYGGTNIWGDATHESALRLVLHMISTTAAKYKKTIEPVLSLSIDFYVRLFIRVKTSPIKVKELASKTMITYHCSGCGNNANQPLGRMTQRDNGTNKFTLAQGPPVGLNCSYCGYVNHLCGPMWGGQLHDKEFIGKMLKITETLDPSIYCTTKRIKGMLTLAEQEIDEPFYFQPTSLSSKLKCAPPSMNVLIAAIGNCGYDASLTHAQPNAIKTNAPWAAILEIYKKWNRDCNIKLIEEIDEKLSKPENKDNIELITKLIETKNLLKQDINPKITENMVGHKILYNDIKPELKVSFEKNELSGKIDKLRKVKIVRYQQNPTKNWGPKAKPE